MKCPKCKKEMKLEGVHTYMWKNNYLVCRNEKCNFYGVLRYIDTEPD